MARLRCVGSTGSVRYIRDDCVRVMKLYYYTNNTFRYFKKPSSIKLFSKKKINASSCYINCVNFLQEERPDNAVDFIIVAVHFSLFKSRILESPFLSKFGHLHLHLN